MTSGFSGTPLAKTLSLRDGQRVWFLNMPEHVADEIDEYALELTFVGNPAKGIDAAHVFLAKRDDLEGLLTSLRQDIAADGQIWISWPTMASKIETDITEEAIREIGEPLGLIDTKACKVDDHWSGIKLVIRKELR